MTEIFPPFLLPQIIKYTLLKYINGITVNPNDNFQYLANSFGAWITRSFMADRLTHVLPAVARLLTSFITSRHRGQRTFHRLTSLPTRT